MSRRLLAFIAVAGLAGCNGITPTAPAPAAAGTALTAASINIIPSPAQLPPAGGISTLYVEVLSAGGGGVRDATVTLTTSTGRLTSTTVRTDSTGHGTTEWSGDRTGRITASLGELTTSATIEVLGRRTGSGQVQAQARSGSARATAAAGSPGAAARTSHAATGRGGRSRADDHAVAGDTEREPECHVDGDDDLEHRRDGAIHGSLRVGSQRRRPGGSRRVLAGRDVPGGQLHGVSRGQDLGQPGRDGDADRSPSRRAGAQRDAAGIAGVGRLRHDGELHG